MQTSLAVSLLAAEAASPGLIGQIVGLLIGSVIGGAIYGLILMLCSGPIGQKPVGYTDAFKTCFTTAIIAGVVGLIANLVIGTAGSFLQMAAFFVASTMLISKNHGIVTGRAAAISGIMLAVMILIVVVLFGIVLAGLMAAGAAGAH